MYIYIYRCCFLWVVFYTPLILSNPCPSACFSRPPPCGPEWPTEKRAGLPSCRFPLRPPMAQWVRRSGPRTGDDGFNSSNGKNLESDVKEPLTLPPAVGEVRLETGDENDNPDI